MITTNYYLLRYTDEFVEKCLPALFELKKKDKRSFNFLWQEAMRQYLVSRQMIQADKPRSKKKKT